MLAAIASLFVFLALAAGAVRLFALAPSGRRAFDQRVRALRPGGGDPGRRAAPPSLKPARSSIPTLQSLLDGSRWATRTAVELRQANVQLRVGEYLLARLLAALLFLVLPVLLLRGHPAGLAVAPVAGAAGYLLPQLYVKAARTRRRANVDRQLSELLPALASSLRSGFGLQQGIEVAIEEVGSPLAEELALLVNDVNLGATMEDALHQLGQRVDSTDLDMVITAILVQRSTGGNLAEILDKAAETLWERERIQGDVLTFTAQQRLTGLILSIYPAGLGLLLLAIMPAFWSKLFTEPVGQVLLAVALGLQLLGFFAIRKALRVDV